MEINFRSHSPHLELPPGAAVTTPPFDQLDPQFTDAVINDNTTKHDGSWTSYPSSPKVTASLVASSSVFWILVKRSAVWICLGVGIMFAGVGIAQAEILPRIHTCLPDATCQGSFDLNKGNVLQFLQVVMTYCIRAGMLVAGIGLTRLYSYQAWLILMRDGNSIQNLDYNLGALKGSLLDACRLILRKGNRGLSALLFGLLLVDTAVSLVIGFSISRDTRDSPITFTYANVSRFPDSSSAHLNNDGQVQAIAKVDLWAMNNDTSHGSALRGSLVVPGSRSKYSVRSAPGGPTISGAITCAGVSTYTIANNSQYYNITIGSHAYLAESNMTLAVSMTSLHTARTDYLWVSNTSGLLPNGTLTSDGKMTFALCNHTVFMVNGSQSAGVQYIEPNVPLTSGCDSDDVNVCVADSVNNAVLSWWGGLGVALWKLSCRGSVVGPLAANGAANCSLSTELWRETLTSMLDGIVQTAPTSGLANQQLVAPIESISHSRWWLQGVIPLGTMLLYSAALYYTCRLGQGYSTIKELTLSEVIGAAQREGVRYPTP